MQNDKHSNRIFFSLIFGKNFRNVWALCNIFISNFFAAILEGASFGFLFLSLSVMTKNSSEFLKENFFLKFFNLSQRIEIFNPQSLFLIFILSAIILQVLKSLGTWIAQYVTAVLTAKIQSNAQFILCKKIFSFSFPKVQQYRSGDLMDYIKSPLIFIQPLMEHLNIFLISFFMICASLSIMMFLSVKLTVLTFFLFAIFGMLQKFFLKKISKSSRDYTKHNVDFSSEVVENLNGIRVLHIFNMQKKFLDKAFKLLSNTSRSLKKMSIWNGILVSYNETISILIIGIILSFGVFLMKEKQDLLFPLLLTFLGLSHRTATRIQLIFKSIGTFASIYGNIFRVTKVLTENDIYQESAKKEKFQTFQSSIEYKKVKIVYPNQEFAAISDFSYRFEKGKTIALVGPSGSGKSTIVDLLLGLYKPTEGQIRIDNKDLFSFDLSSWRTTLGVVSQDVFLFQGTIEQNIRFGLENAPFEKIKEAAIKARADDFITKLPKGYQTMVGEKGYRLSGGEKQRIALARAFIRDPKVLILDEATSNLDSHSEKLIQETIEKNQHQRTILIVAHRLSTIIHSDEILVIKNGKIIEIGTHEYLLKGNGFYAYLWGLQSTKNTNSVLV